MKRVLIVDDEWKLRRLIRDYLIKNSFDVEEVSDGEECLDILKIEKFDIIILDVMMERMDGWETLREIRKTSEIPVVMLTAREEEEDQLLGYELGVDEYITKPFNPQLLIAKLKAILRRGERKKIGKDKILGEVQLNLEKREVKLKGDILDLAPKEFELLCYFMENVGICLSREKILNSVWGWDYFGDERTVDTHIKRLRKKIGEEYIQTVRGYGYKMEL